MLQRYDELHDPVECGAMRRAGEIMLQGGQLTVVRRLVGDRHEDPVGLREDALHAAQDTVGVEDDGIVVDRGAQDLDKLWKLRIPQRRDILR